MIKIEYPSFNPKIKNENNNQFIFDNIRKRWIVLTPEEWVRQNFLNYLIVTKKYPSSLIAVEKEITINGLTRRFDIVVYDKNTQPWMLVECKEMEVPLTQKTLKQTLDYQLALQPKFVVLTNGKNCFAYSVINQNIEILYELPSF